MALRFSSDHGENIFLTTILEAEWRTSYSGGLCFSEGPVGKDPLRIRIYGSSHVVIGYLEKNPNKLQIREVLSQIKSTCDVRVHKSTFQVSMRLSNDGRHLVLDSDNKRSERFVVGKGHTWLVVYIQFGSASIYLESPNAKFAQHRGANIKLSKNDTQASLICENPAASCYIKRPIYRGEVVNIQIEPVKDLVKAKPCCLPSIYYIKFGFLQNTCTSPSLKQSYPALFKVSADTRSMQWEPVHILEKNKCVGKLQLGVSGSGQFVYAAETGANGSFSIPEFNQENGVLCVLELFRARAKLLDVSTYPDYDYPSVCDVSNIKEPNGSDGDLNIQETSLFETNNLTEINLKMCTSLDTNYDETKVKEIENTDGSKTQLKSCKDVKDSANIMPCLHNEIVQDLSTLPRDNVTYDQKDDDFKVSDNDNRLNTDMPQCSAEGGTLSTRDYNFLTDESPKVSDNNNRLNIDMPQCSGERGTLSTRDYNFLTNEFPQVKLLNIPVEKNTKNTDVDLCENCNYDDENNVNVTATLSQNDIEKQNAILTNENAELKTALSNSIAKCENLKLENKRLMEIIDRPEILALQARENQESPTIPDNSISESVQIRTVIQHNFVRFVNDLEIRDLCDHLYQRDQITNHDLDELHQLNTKDKRDANRHLLTLIRKRAIPSDILVSALVATKQDGLVHILQKEK